MTDLLVSVRSADEARAVVAGGAALVDVKEPAHGALGRAEDAVLADVLRAVAGRRPVSAALGELHAAAEAPLPAVVADLAFVKWGLAQASGWRAALWSAAERLARAAPRCRVVVTAYADWQRAGAPAPEEACAFAGELPAGAFLLDTWGKDGRTLLDWLDRAEVERLCRHCRTAGVPVALAGSLGPEEIRTLRPLHPDWFAVRGAVCRGRRRAEAVDAGQVRRLVALLMEERPGS